MSSWSEADRDEYREMCHLAHSMVESQTDRIDRYIDGLDGALATNRMWARDVERELIRVGAIKEMSFYAKSIRPRVAVSFEGERLTKARVVGGQYTDAEGRKYSAQTLFDYLTFEQIRDKAHEYIANIRAHQANLALATRLLLLADEVPEALTPHDALATLGVSMQEWLDGPQAETA
jgi:hypothetical protein